MAHYGTKGWYVAELKKLGITKIEGHKTEKYKAHVLASALEKAKAETEAQ